MSDFVNQMMPVANPDPDGLYPWMSVRAGGSSNVFGNLRVTRPLNLGNRFIYNELGEISGAYHKYNNTIASASGASATGHSVILTPNAGAVVEATTNPPSPDCVVDGSFLTIDNATGAEVRANVYARIVFTGYTAGVPINPPVPVDGDTIRIGIVDNGALPAPGALTQDVVVFGQYGEPSYVVLQAHDYPVPAGTNIQIRFVNLTNVLRGILVKDVQLIATWTPAPPPPPLS